MIAESSHEMKVLCVISEPEYINICEEYGFEWVASPNNPVGGKINNGIIRGLQNQWDYLMMMNSDNVIKTELIEKYYQPFFESRERFFGISKVTYVNFGTDEAREYDYQFSILGIGKCIRRDVVELAFKSLGELYRTQLNKCLDDTMFDNLLKLKVLPRIVPYKGMLAMDFKSEVNIWPWEKFKDKGKPVCFNLGYAEAN